MPKQDRRVRRTRRRLQDALISLILEIGYENITVQNITDRADLSRATFYLHFRDKDELLVSSLGEIYDQLASSLEDEKTPIQQPIVLAFEHVEEYSDLYRSLLIGDHGVTHAIYREIHYLTRLAKGHIQRILPPDTQLNVPEPILIHHTAGALFALIVWWLENDMPHSPQYMADIFQNLSIPGLHHVLQLPQDKKP